MNFYILIYFFFQIKLMEIKSNFKFFLILIFSFIFYIKTDADTIRDLGGLFPISLTLHNENILLITKDQITFYDSSLTSIIKVYNLSESEIASDVDETYKTNIYQYSQEDNSYILVSVKDQLYFFDEEGNYINKVNLSLELNSISYYEITPIKNKGNNLYYIIAYTNKTEFTLNFFYYKMNIISYENSLILNYTYITKIISGNNVMSISNNVACVLMNSKEKNDILTCFYSLLYPIQISITSFSLDNDYMNELESYSTQLLFDKTTDLNFFKAISIGDKSKAFIVFIRYNVYGYSAIYDINNNSLFSIEQRVGHVGSSEKCLNIQYFEITEQYVLFFRGDNKDFKVIVADKNFNILYNENGDETFRFRDTSAYVNREAIVYLKDQKRYFVLSDATYNSQSLGIKIYSFNITVKVTNNYKENDIESTQIISDSSSVIEEDTNIESTEIVSDSSSVIEEDKNIESTEIISDSSSVTEEDTNIESTEIVSDSSSVTEEDTNIESTEIVSDSTSIKEKNIENKSEEELIVVNKESINIDDIIILNEKNNKCFSITNESLILNLCVSCNEDYDYYPVDFKKYNLFNKGFKECFNNKTKLNNFYFNEEKKQYEPCFETCNTCNSGGNEEINNCTSCDIDSIFRPETNGTTNCVKKCKYKYYFSLFDQYKCTENDQCPNDAILLIKEKNKCIQDCKFDDTYRFQYNGECLKKCPNNTKEENNICKNIDYNKCSYKENKNYLNENFSNKDLDLLVKVYGEEYNYTNNHVSLYKNNFHTIAIYKNKDCVNNLLNITHIDFGSCYNKIKSNNYNNLDLIILILEKYKNDSSIVLYYFYDPISLEKIDLSNKCQNENITIEKYILKSLLSSNIDIDKVIDLGKQNIDIFDKNNKFYNDICFNYESPNGKDIPLKDRLKVFYPNISLCDNDCLYKGVNLTSMTSLCQCKFSDFVGDNYFTENVFVSKISGEIIEMYLKSNLQILQCYDDVFTYKYFIKNTGGFIIISLIICQTLCILIFYLLHLQKITRYIFIMTQTYLFFLEKTTITNEHNIISFIDKVASPNPKKIENQLKTKNKTRKKTKKKTRKNEKLSAVIYQNNSNIIKLNINKLEIKKSFQKNENKVNKKKYNSSNSIMKILRKKNSKNESRMGSLINKMNLRKTTEKIRFKNKCKSSKPLKPNELKYKLDKFVENYLSNDLNDFDYDDAIKLDNRKFCQYFWEKLKSNIFVLDIIFVYEPLKPRSIKILLFLINIDLFFLINGLFMNEDYISEIYHSNDNWNFFSFVKRTNNNLFYISTIGAFIGYLITCFFIEEKKLKNIFIREKNNKNNIQAEIYLLNKKIKSNFMIFFIMTYIITLCSWYFISCFNNVYSYTKIEWIISSICIHVAMQMLYLFLTLFETIMRYLSFKIKSEKIFKISKIFS